MALAVAACAAPAAASADWQPGFQDAVAYAQGRKADWIEFAVRTEHHYWGYQAQHDLPSASVIKAMILVVYLDLPSVRDRKLTPTDHGILDPMIEQSDDHATNRAFDKIANETGDANRELRRLAERVGMTNFHTNSQGVWGQTQVDARDQTLFFLHLGGFIGGQRAVGHRKVARYLLEHVIPSERWGVAQAQPPGWHLYFKSGWGFGSGWVDHQSALLVRDADGGRVSVAILQHHPGSDPGDPNWEDPHRCYHDYPDSSCPHHRYGTETLRGIAERLLRGLDTAPPGSVR